MYKLLLYIVAFLLPVVLLAHNPNIENITTRSGLSQNDVTCIYQDSQGFIWFGTNDGLNRYDGKEFRIYRSSTDELTSIIIHDIVEDQNKNLWIATIDEGINKLNLPTGKIEQFRKQSPEGKSVIDDEISSLVCDREGVVWYCSKKGIGKIIGNGDETHIINFKTDTLPDNFFANPLLFVDEEGRVLLMTNQAFYHVQDSRIAKTFEIRDGFLKSICQSENGFIIGTSKGIFFISKENFNSNSYAPDYFSDISPSDIILDNNRNLWVGTREEVFKFIFSESKSAFVPDHEFELNKSKSILSKLKVLNLYKDKTGIIYFGTYGQGAVKYNVQGKKFRYYALTDGTGGNKVRSVTEDEDGNLYVGKDFGLLHVLPSSVQKNYETGFVSKNFFPGFTKGINRTIYTILEAKNGEGKKMMLAGTDPPASILKLSGGNFHIPTLNSMVFSLAQGPNGLIWAGTYEGGLFRIDPSGKLPLKRFTADGTSRSLRSDIIRSLMFDSKNRLWIGTSKGLHVLTANEQEKESPSFVGIVYDPAYPGSLSHNYILPLFESATGDIWVGTMGGGLNRLKSFDKDGKAEFEHITVADGLPNNVVKSILEDDFGNLWISTNKGICKFNPDDKTFENYDVNDGLQDYEFSELAACKRQDGEMVFGGVNGINVFYPNEIEKNTSEALPAFTRFTILNRDVEAGDFLKGRIILDKEINFTDRIKLKYSENSFAIRFASLNYALPEKNKCMYMLEGFDQEWILAPSGDVAKYTNIPPGEYVLKVKAANSDGIWGHQIKEIEIDVLPPFVWTMPAKIFYILLIVLALWFFRKYSVIGVNRKHELIMKEMEKQKDNEIIQAKLRFFTNISHEFKTPLTLIIGPLEQLLNRAALPPENMLKEFHKMIYRHAKVLLRLIDQLLEFRKLEQGIMKLKVKEGNIRNFLREIYDSFLPLAESKKINFLFLDHSFRQDFWFDHDKLEKVIYNVLSNAFKFTDKGGNVNLELLEDDSDYLTIIISDTGSGIPEEAQPHIFNRFFRVENSESHFQSGTGIGLSYSKSLVELMKGSISFKSKAGEGTSFFIKLPKDSKVFNENELTYSVTPDPATEKEVYPEEKAPVVLPETATQPVNEELCTILIVEDNEDLREFLKNLFSLQFNVYTANNGQEGLNKCLEILPDVVVSDVSMPVMDGIEMTRQLKESFETSHIPVVLLTVRAEDEEQKVGLQGGADVYIKKPFNSEILVSQILSLIKNRQLLRAKYREKIMVTPSEIAPSNRDEQFVKKILKIVEDNLSNPEFSVQWLASEYGMSQTSLNKKLVVLTGQKAKIFIRTIRLKRAAQLLKQDEKSIAEITYEVGFNDLQYFRKCFVEEFGCLPNEYSFLHRKKD
ncbi:MAG: two-component regulator propeller domain-containing protein [Prolixibacteraceae bacterium]|jgi:signal transduction histidine kinase/ligand-binding sensor domain-containing protein/DNA-binding NarL/FixJ family response regulator|nr:two-component regulator propeller domain-containing protein [Prolixibacteraceae bacterium]